MPKKLPQLTPQELAKHLKQPDGETGKEVGLQMNKGNQHICLNSYSVLKPKNGDHILEIGMGNGFFIKDLLKMASNLSYVGVDFSPTMIEEAQLLNRKYIDSGVVSFKQASIETLPFADNTFDSITTTNTIYFWPQPKDNTKELLRVLKPGGRLLIAYRPKNFMDGLELTKYGFEKYHTIEIETLLTEADFKEVNTKNIKEPDLDFGGQILEMSASYTMGIKE